MPPERDTKNSCESAPRLAAKDPTIAMTGRGGGGGGGRGKVLLPPINFIFKLLQQRSTVSIWLYEQLAVRIEGKIRVRHTQRDLGVDLADTCAAGL